MCLKKKTNEIVKDVKSGAWTWSNGYIKLDTAQSLLDIYKTKKEVIMQVLMTGQEEFSTSVKR